MRKRKKLTHALKKSLLQKFFQNFITWFREREKKKKTNCFFQPFLDGRKLEFIKLIAEVDAKKIIFIAELYNSFSFKFYTTST